VKITEKAFREGIEAIKLLKRAGCVCHYGQNFPHHSAICKEIKEFLKVAK